MLVRNELQPIIAYNDPNGRWMVVQCILQGQDYEVDGIYAHTVFGHRANLRGDISSHSWTSNAMLCGDFNNASDILDNTSGHSHML